jgi:Flp pilus assembly protein TadG
MMKQPACMKKSEKGQSMVELALVLVVVMILVAGVVDLGGMMFQVLAMRDAASEGAAYASIYPTDCNGTTQRVRDSLHNADPTQVFVDVTVNNNACTSPAAIAAACAANEVKVTVRQPEFSLSMPFLGTFLGKQTINLTSNMSSTIVRPPCP